MLSKQDIQFGKIALREGMLTREQLNRAVHIKNRLDETKPGLKSVALAAVMLKKGYLTRDQIDHVVGLHNETMQSRGESASQGSDEESPDAGGDFPDQPAAKTRDEATSDQADQEKPDTDQADQEKPDTDQADQEKPDDEKPTRSSRRSKSSKRRSKTSGGTSGRKSRRKPLAATGTRRGDKIVVGCPDCGKKFAAKSKQLGRKFRCRGCGEVLRLPTAEDIPTRESGEESAALEQPAKSARKSRSSKREKKSKKSVTSAESKPSSDHEEIAAMDSDRVQIARESKRLIAQQIKESDTASAAGKEDSDESTGKFSRPNPGVLTAGARRTSGGLNKKAAWERAKAAMERAKQKQRDRDSGRLDENSSARSASPRRFVPAQRDVLERSGEEIDEDGDYDGVEFGGAAGSDIDPEAFDAGDTAGEPEAVSATATATVEEEDAKARRESRRRRRRARAKRSSRRRRTSQRRSKRAAAAAAVVAEPEESAVAESDPEAEASSETAEEEGSSYATALSDAIADRKEKDSTRSGSAAEEKLGLAGIPAASPVALIKAGAVLLLIAGGVVGAIVYQAQQASREAEARRLEVHEQTGQFDKELETLVANAQTSVSSAEERARKGEASDVIELLQSLLGQIDKLSDERISLLPTQESRNYARNRLVNLQVPALQRDMHLSKGHARRLSGSLLALDQAVLDYQAAYDLDGASLSALEAMAELESFRWRFAKAGADYDRLIDRAKQLSEEAEVDSQQLRRWQIARVRAKALAGMYAEADEAILPLVKSDPGLGVLRARIRGLAGSHRSALQDCDQAAQAGFAASAGFARGQLLLGQRKLVEARAAFSQLATAESADPRGPYGLGLAAEAGFDYQAAQAHFEDSVRRNDRFVPGLIGQARAHDALLQEEEALRLLDRAVLISQSAVDLEVKPPVDDPLDWQPRQLLSQVRRLKAEVLVRQGELGHAAAELDLAVINDACDPRSRQERARLRLARSDLRGAHDDLEVARSALLVPAAELSPDAPLEAAEALRGDSIAAEYLTAVGMLQVSRKEWGRAERALRQAVRLAKGDPQVHALYGATLLALSNIGGAKRELEKAQLLERDPTTAAGHALVVAKEAVDAALSSKDGKEYHRARQLLKRGLSLHDRHVAILLEKARLELGFEEWDALLSDLQRVSEANPFFIDVYLQRGLLLIETLPEAMRDPAAAIKDFEFASELDSERVEAWFGLGVARYMQNDINQAYNDLSRAIETDVGYAEAYRYRYYLNVDRGDKAAADRDAKDYKRLTGRSVLD